MLVVRLWEWPGDEANIGARDLAGVLQVNHSLQALLSVLKAWVGLFLVKIDI